MVTAEETPDRVVRFEVATPESIVSIDAPRLSPDGKYLAFNATDSDGKTQIWLRQLNSLTAQPLAGTDGASRPFWSPDSRFLAFMAEGKLKKIDVGGGPTQKIADAPSGADGSWSSEGVILYDGRTNDPIYRVAAAGGIPTVAVKPDPSRKETAVGWPEFLPDGRHFLYLAMAEKPEDTAYRIGTIDSEETEPLASAQTQVAFAPPGYLMFVRDKTLMAQPFDVKSLKTTGEPVPLAERIGTDSVGLARFSVSRDGTLAYRTGDSGSRLIFVNRDGRELETVTDVGEITNPAISRDGRRIAYDLGDMRSGKVDIWIRDLARGVSSRFTFGSGSNFGPVWSPDGSRVVFQSTRNGVSDLFEKPASGQGEESLLLKSDQSKTPIDWSRDGRYIAYMTRDAKTDLDLWALPTFGDRKPIPVVVSPATEMGLVFSPDGRFVAYRSNESGANQIYVQPFPQATGKWQVSNAGGLDPSWRADGKELIYRAPDQRLMSVEIRPGQDFQVSVPRPLFVARVQVTGNARNRYATAADGQRFLLVAPPGRDTLVPTTVVLNWSAELGR
jgi:Tol biopolymer transport system component